MQKSLLAHIAGSFITQYENVANSSVCYLLNEYTAAYGALKGVLQMDAVPVYYKTEEATRSGGRPDITGKDADGGTKVIIEGKFWANLTENQPIDYLRELDDGGRLLFLCPGRRAQSLELELRKRVGDEDWKRILIYSWNDFLSAVERSNTKTHDAGLASDLAQLRALCQKMDVEGMPPLSASDLDPMNGRLPTQLADVIDACNLILREWEHADFTGLKTTPSKYGYGFYFRGYDFGCNLSFLSKEWFERNIHAPIWLEVRGDGENPFAESEKVNDALKFFDPSNAYGNELGIILKPDMDKNQVVDHIVARVKQALTYVNERIVK
ncbi:MAG: hypothetical protein ACR2P7_09235 [bacterium]